MSNSELLWQTALIARNNAYAPYSGFAVGAAVEDENGNIYGGCNVENISYPCGTCAEAGAISAMIAGGGRRIRAILIVSGGSNLITPCGACRQRIAEFCDSDTPVFLADTKGIKQTVKIGDLLPNSFHTFDTKDKKI